MLQTVSNSYYAHPVHHIVARNLVKNILINRHRWGFTFYQQYLLAIWIVNNDVRPFSLSI